jgi:DNA-binding CsgD family transcriptional regulator
MPGQGTAITRRRDEVLGPAVRAGSVNEVFERASDRLRRIVPYDAAVWMATDPATNLPTAPARAENLGHVCRGDTNSWMPVWELEFYVADVNLYRDLARADTPAAALRLSTDDRPARSARYRELLRPSGFEDELRAVLRVDGSAWASVGLYRKPGRPVFNAAEAALVAGLSKPLATAIRDHARPATAEARPVGQGPGLMVFSSAGELISINDDARAWLDELPSDTVAGDESTGLLPMVIAATLMRARAIAADRQHGSARARLRSRSGRWLVCHASCLRDADGGVADTALVIEPAAGSEISSLVIEAYELSSREQQVTHLIARGYSSAEIAARLHLSIHTVRDYVKAVFEKVGVSSRGELVAKLFADHYVPVHMAPGSQHHVEA